MLQLVRYLSHYIKMVVSVPTEGTFIATSSPCICKEIFTHDTARVFTFSMVH